ncbi:hypothetical protein ElyMa_003703400 [Elysia marginata]|uniref:Uncharacterized protein n=1 Tax=Elysia marginata TaxID=1093978 RepID=A0AAV4F327_9GAST|nr:hypothetical protein ElyMa_003703400 [Elysia marginata]
MFSESVTLSKYPMLPVSMEVLEARGRLFGLKIRRETNIPSNGAIFPIITRVPFLRRSWMPWISIFLFPYLTQPPMPVIFTVHVFTVQDFLRCLLPLDLCAFPSNMSFWRQPCLLVSQK